MKTCTKFNDNPLHNANAHAQLEPPMHAQCHNADTWARVASPDGAYDMI